MCKSAILVITFFRADLKLGNLYLLCVTFTSIHSVISVDDSSQIDRFQYVKRYKRVKVMNHGT
jgi:hypothetical protein